MCECQIMDAAKTKKTQWVPWSQKLMQSGRVWQSVLVSNLKQDDDVPEKASLHRVETWFHLLTITSGELTTEYQEHLHSGGLLLPVLAARTHLRILYISALCIKRLDDSLPLF